MKVQFENRVYDILKWLCLIALPAASVLYSALAGVWGWDYAQEVAVKLTKVEAAGGTVVLQYMPHELVGNYFDLAN